MLNFCLTELLQGSLCGGALTGMITCMSQHPRNGDETYLSLKYGAGMAQLLNCPVQQTPQDFKKMHANAVKQLAASSAVIAKGGGVNGKYQLLRQAEVAQWTQEVHLLNELGDGEEVH